MWAGVGWGCCKEPPPIWLEAPSRTQILAPPSHLSDPTATLLPRQCWKAPAREGLHGGSPGRGRPSGQHPPRIRCGPGRSSGSAPSDSGEEELVSGCNAEGKNEDTETRPPARPQAQDSHGRGRGDLLLFCWNPVTTCPPIIPQPTDCYLINSLPGVSSVDAQPTRSYVHSTITHAGLP